MSDVDVSSIGSQVIGIAGAGIGLGILAGTARGVMDTMYPQQRQRCRPARAPYRGPRARQFQPKPYKPRRQNPYFKPYRYKPRW